MRRLVNVAVLLLLVSLHSGSAHAASSSLKSDIKKIISKKNLRALPTLGSQVTSFKTKTSSSSVSSLATPPTLKSIPGTPIKSLFWRSIDGVNVIDSLNSGNPSVDACSEFFAGSQDGESGGLGACHLAESVGYSYSNIVMSGVASCFVKNLPTKANEQAGGITLNAGTYPSNNIEKLFSTPSSGTRLVKINTTGAGDTSRTTYVQLPDAAALKSDKKLYSANMWFCDSNNQVVAYDMISISNSLLYTVTHADQDNGKKVVSLTGFIEKDGANLDWNAAKTRTANTSAQEAHDGDGLFKTSIEILKSNQIRLKRIDNFNSVSKSYQVSKYSGNSAADLRFLAGAFNEVHGDHAINAGIDFPTSFYAVDTGSSYRDVANGQDLTSGFYAEPLVLTFDSSSYSCGATPDIEITVDTGNASLQATVGKCEAESRSLQNMHFCHDDPQIKQAEENFKTNCAGKERRDPQQPAGTPTPPPTPTPRSGGQNPPPRH